MGEIKGVTSGTGFNGLFPDEAAIGDSGIAGHKYKPISRWTEYPFQLYREGESEQPAYEGTSDPEHLYFGIMAYHAEGIKEVDFVLNGGATVTVTDQELNPYTHLPEYCVRVNKADVINPENSDPTSDSDFTNNMELRAIVRPNSGIPRIHQHDKDVVLGADMTLLTGYYTGFSGGKGDLFFDKKTTPGEFSQIGTVLKANDDYGDDSLLKTITVYMDPDGNDNNEGTKESPVKTTGKALLKIRDLAMDVQARLLNEDGSGNHYVDVTRSEIVLLAGRYTAEHFGQDQSPLVGWETRREDGEDVDFDDPAEPRPICKRGWFIVRGDSEADRKDVILTLTDDEAKLKSDEKPWQNHSSDFSLIDQNRYLNCFKLEHVTIERSQTSYKQTTLGFRVKENIMDDFVAGHTAESDLYWFHDVTIRSDSYAEIHPKGTFIKGERTPDQAILISASGKERSKILGGDEISIAFVNMINTDCVKVDGDNLKQLSMALSVTVKGNNHVFGSWRRIWFDPEKPEAGEARVDTSPYTQFSGYYGAIRYTGAAIGEDDELDENGSRFYEPGTLNEYIRIHNLNSPEGVTLSWPENPGSGDGEVTATGTIWQKMNHTNLLDVNLPWLDDPVSETDYTLTTYRQWGEKYGDPTADDPYFGSMADKDPPVLSEVFAIPKVSRHHCINPQKASQWFFTDEPVTREMNAEQKIANAKETVGSGLFDPTPGATYNSNNKFYEPIYCTMLKYEDSNLGITAWGQILFDASKPIAANPDVEGWGTTQDFLFRLAGTTWPSAGRKLDGKVNSMWQYPIAQFQPNPNGLIDRGQYNVAWCAGITSQGLSMEHRGTASYDDFATTPILPENTHPVIGWCTLGGRDTNHCDSMQYFGTKQIDSIHTIENGLIAYCNFILDGQGGNMTGDKVCNLGYNDMAWINNVWSNVPLPSLTGLNYQPPSQRHVLWYHNTIHNLNFTCGLGLEIEKRGGEMDQDGKGTNRVLPFKDNGPADGYLASVYGTDGGTTFALPLEQDAIVYRNNYFSRWNQEFSWIQRGLGLPYKDTYHTDENGDDVDREGITWPYINIDTHPLRVERNFRWNGGPIDANEEVQALTMNVLSATNPPLFASMTVGSGGGTVEGPQGVPEAGFQTPWQLNELSHRVLEGSPLKGGGTLGLEKDVQFDLDRKRRIGHATIGAYEVPSSDLTEGSEYVSQTSVNSSTNGEVLFPPISDGSNVISFNLDDVTHGDLYAKRIKVKATKGSGDDTEVRFADNIMRLTQDISVHEGVEARTTLRISPPSGSDTNPALRTLFDDPLAEIYNFTFNNSTINPYVNYTAPQYSESFVPFAGSDPQEYEDEYQDIDTDPSQIETWLKTSHNIESIQIFGSNYQSATSRQNKIKLSFDDGTTQGTTFATNFHTAYAAAGGTIGIPFPNGTTFFVDKIAGGMTAHGSSLESYFYLTAPGTTVSLAGALPTGAVVIERPKGL